jgi:hypothetical protein
MASSVAKNAIIATVVFENTGGVATDPDSGSDIVFTIYGQDQTTVRATDTQAVAEKIATGTYRFIFVPTVVETIYIEAIGVVDSVQQATRVAHTVGWT